MPVSGRTRLLTAALIAAAAAIRLLFVEYRSGDLVRFLEPWARYIDTHGGFAALADHFSNYNMPYLYLMAAFSYLPWSPLVQVKVISLLFEALLAWSVYRLLSATNCPRWVPPVGASAVLLLPTVVLNGSMWGQADALYTACVVAGLAEVVRDRSYRSCVWFGLALAFKLQAVFFFPALLLFVLRRKVSWPALLLIPATYLLLDVPAFLLGADPARLLLIYLNQAEKDVPLSVNAPTVYTLLPAESWLRPAGVLATGALLICLIVVALIRRIELNPQRILLISALSATLVPFLLPSMHERYFYLAEVLTLVAAFAVGSRLVVLAPIVLQLAVLPVYFNYLLKPFRGGGPVAPEYQPGYESIRYFLPLPQVDLRGLAVLVMIAIGLTWSGLARCQSGLALARRGKQSFRLRGARPG